MITIRHLLFPFSSARNANSVPYGSPAIPAAIRVYQVPFNIQKVRAGSVSPPEISVSMCSGCPVEQPDLVPFWFRPSSIFGLLPITVFINSSHVLTLLTSLAIKPHDACSKGASLTEISPG